MDVSPSFCGGGGRRKGDAPLRAQALQGGSSGALASSQSRLTKDSHNRDPFHRVRGQAAGFGGPPGQSRRPFSASEAQAKLQRIAEIVQE